MNLMTLISVSFVVILRRINKLPKIILYTTDCPKCLVLEKKLEAGNYKFKEEKDIGVMKEKGIFSAPVLEVDGELKNFLEAIKWVNKELN